MSSELRNIELSVDYRIWQILRQTQWSVPVTNVPLLPITEDPVTKEVLPANTYGTEDGMPWVFIDEQGYPDVSSVAIYDGGVPVTPSSYTLDCRNARVTLNTLPLGNLTVNAATSAAHVLEGYPDEEWLKINNLPVLAWTNTLNTGTDFALGTIIQDRVFNFTIDIIASNKGECSDLLSDLMRYIVKVPYVNMQYEQPVDGNGSANINFNPDLQIEGYLVQRFKPRGEKVAPRQGGLDKERHRALITFNVQRIS